MPIFRPLLLILAMMMFLTSIAIGQQTDPFAALFGEEETDDEANGNGGDSPVSLVRIQVRGIQAAIAVPLYNNEVGACILFDELIEALEFPIKHEGSEDTPAEQDPDRRAGWFIDPSRTIFIDFITPSAIREGTIVPLSASHVAKTPEGWCITADGIATLFPLSAVYNPRTLRLSITPDEILPLEARLERLAQREDLETRPERTVPDFPEIANPYRWLDWPVADVTIDVSARNNDQSAALSLDVAGDFFKATGRLRSTGGTDNNVLNSLRFTLSRMNSAPGELGPLKARRFAIGDINAPALSLLSRSRTGVGFTITNEPELSADLFDRTEIRGPLPEGWEAELYTGEQLLAFVTSPDENGDYVFDDVLLQPGMNIFEVRLFGPFGEVETRTVRQFAGADLRPENEATYSFGVVNGDRHLFTQVESAGGFPGDTQPREGTLAFAQISRGLTKSLTAQIDGIIGFGGTARQDTALSASLFTSVLGGYGALQVASDGQSRPALRALFQRPLSASTGLTAAFTDFGGLSNEITGEGDARLERAGEIRLNTTLPFPGKIIPVQAAVDWQTWAGGGHRLNASLRGSARFFGTQFTKSLRLLQTQDEATSDVNVQGDLLAVKSIRGVRLRGALAYDLSSTSGITSLSLAAQKQLGRRHIVDANIVHDFNQQSSNLTANWSRAFSAFILSGNFGIDTAGIWSAGLRLSFSLFRDRTTRRPQIGLPGLTRSGAIRPFVFEDTNGDGMIGAGERRIEGVQFIVGNALRSEETGIDGQAIISDLPIGEALNAEIRLSSVEDPFLRPASLGTAVNIRPGQVVNLPVALLPTGDAEGNVIVVSENSRIPVSGVVVQFLNDRGELITETQTEFDGYFYADGLPYGEITVRIANFSSGEIIDAANTVDIILSNSFPSALGLEIKIEDKK